jgi:hypothetical protein
MGVSKTAPWKAGLAILAGACVAASAAPAAGGVITMTFSGTVASFIDTDDVYGFGAGANLAGLPVTDTYVFDTAYTTLASGQPFGPGSADNEYTSDFGGLSMASSTIDGSTITFTAANGDSLVAYSQQIYLGQGSPPNVYNQSILELQAIGEETTGTEPGTAFLIRDEVVSYSLVLPLTLSSGYSLSPSSLTTGPNAGFYQGVYFPYAAGAGPGWFDITAATSTGVPEPSGWVMLCVGFAALGAAARARRPGRAVAAA